ncbi:porin [Klebsiella pneumoniae]|uniref:porin n=1 Tax=Klebsiella pneumoniae TaxID=573 RepID=UPI001D0D9F70|nr:porin [Klebsiella pneumoniae]
MQRQHGMPGSCGHLQHRTGFPFNKNMSTYVDYKINLLDENDFTRRAGISTDDVVALGLVYQF